METAQLPAISDADVYTLIGRLQVELISRDKVIAYLQSELARLQPQQPSEPHLKEVK